MVDKEKEKVNKELKMALTEIGKIEPWFDPDFNCWIFSHPLYPVECEGTTASTVIKKYPKYLKTFIEHRIKDKLDPINEKKTKGKGGYRPGAGRPKGSTKEQTKQRRVPTDIAEWFDLNPQAFDQIRLKLMNKPKHA